MKELAQYLEHTLLRPDAIAADIERLCAEAVDHGVCGVCVNPVHIPFVSRLLKGEVPVPVSVIGFPLGACSSAMKAREAAEVAEQGAAEIDMVINLSVLKDGHDSLVVEDIRGVVAAGVPVKVILETGLLDNDEIVHACRLCVEAGAAFVKTCTGFGTGSATVEHIRLMRETVGIDVGVKASGGIRTAADAQAMIDAGANRIGTSSTLNILKGE